MNSGDFWHGFNWPSFMRGIFIGVVISVVTVSVSETPEERHAREMAEMKEFQRKKDALFLAIVRALA